MIAQASNAVSVVLKRPEQQGTPQHVEAEKLLLLSSQKRQSALNEIQVIKPALIGTLLILIAPVNLMFVSLLW